MILWKVSVKKIAGSRNRKRQYTPILCAGKNGLIIDIVQIHRQFLKTALLLDNSDNSASVRIVTCSGSVGKVRPPHLGLF